jgi:hypothetical protein
MLERHVADRIASRLGKPFRPAGVHVVARVIFTPTGRSAIRLRSITLPL